MRELERARSSIAAMVQRGVVEPGVLEPALERTLSEAEDGLIDV